MEWNYNMGIKRQYHRHGYNNIQEFKYEKKDRKYFTKMYTGFTQCDGSLNRLDNIIQGLLFNHIEIGEKWYYILISTLIVDLFVINSTVIN